MESRDRAPGTRSTSLRVVIAGGGTGGHLYPGIAVARAFLARDPATVVSFAGTAGGIESRVIPREGFELDLIRSAGLKGKSPAALLRGTAILPLSALDAWTVLSRRRPDVVIGVGGYSSGPIVALAALRGIPTMVLEQNAIPGLTNRLLARGVRAAAVTYEESLRYFGSKGFVSGNPVRQDFFQPPSVEGRDERSQGAEATARPIVVLIFGGSQGAHAINAAMVDASEELARSTRRLSLVHQTGERDLDMVRESYGRSGLSARVEPFLYAMHLEMAAADLVVCRAGATTLAELAAAGKPAVLIPFPLATDDHQQRNANVLARADAADVIPQSALTGGVIASKILGLAADGNRRGRMAAAMHRFARPDAARAIVERAVVLAGIT